MRGKGRPFLILLLTAFLSAFTLLGGCVRAEAQKPEGQGTEGQKQEAEGQAGTGFNTEDEGVGGDPGEQNKGGGGRGGGEPQRNGRAWAARQKREIWSLR